VCSGAKVAASDPVTKGRLRVELDSVGSKPNVHISFENVAKVFRHNLFPRLIDFLEIASYVFSADCATQRGRKWADDDSTEPWGRDLSFIIPVRQPDFWQAPRIKDLIEEVLGFLSNDNYSFRFVPLQHDRADQQRYFEFGDLEEWPFQSPERVLMFSGGLDSLAGAVETAVAGTKSVLVSHRPVSTLDSRQKKLFSELQKRFPGQFIHVPVWINKSESFGREPTQRTRSFLYSALGTLVAQSVHAGGVRFYENGIVSLNLPIAQEAIRSRASRTTHPLALHLLASLCAAVTERDFSVDNPFLFKTKTEVVTTLATHETAYLIADSCSCSHSMFQSKTQHHCGRCSQCIDRRFATTAAGLLSYDSEKDYVIDVFGGPRKDPLEKAIALDYTRHGIELHQRSENELAALFNAEISRAVRYELKRSEAAQKIIAMHKRHGETVTRVLEQKVSENATKLVEGTLDSTSLLALTLGQGWPRHQQAALETKAEQSKRPDSGLNSSSPQELQGGVSARIAEAFMQVLRKFGIVPSTRPKKRKKPKLTKAETVIFAAIILGLKSTRYCSFLHRHGIRPRWEETAPSSYPEAYKAGEPWRKKIQDQKTRARQRMNSHSPSELATAINTHLPDEFDQISPFLDSHDSHNSHNARKSSLRQRTHKYSIKT
jgi:hypothetical protein